MISVFIAVFKKTRHDIADKLLHSSIEKENGMSVLIWQLGQRTERIHNASTGLFRAFRQIRTYRSGASAAVCLKVRGRAT
ncbi:hypothetical protein MRX96_013504 [Rhipicephalus microplus]